MWAYSFASCLAAHDIPPARPSSRRLPISSCKRHALLQEEGELHGAFSQQVVVCPSSIPPRLLLALLGGGGAPAAVCPRGSSQAGEAGGDQQSAEAASKPAAGGRGEEAFWLAFYSALQRGATLAAALGEAEGAHPALAGVYGVHGICDGVLVTLL